MNENVKFILNVLLLFGLVACTVFLIHEVSLLNGQIALIIIILTFIFNVIKQKYISFCVFMVGFCVASFYLISGAIFQNNKIKYKFDIPVSINFETGTFEQTLTKAKKLDKPIFIQFYQRNSFACYNFTETVLANLAVSDAMNRAFLNLDYDIETEEGKRIAQKYNVNVCTTFIGVDKNGVLLDELRGDIFRSRITDVLYKDLPQYQPYAFPNASDLIAYSKKYSKTVADSIKTQHTIDSLEYVIKNIVYE